MLQAYTTYFFNKKRRIERRNKMKKIILVLVAMIVTIALQAQQFDWAKSYSGQDDDYPFANNQTIASANDSQGNLYVLGEFGTGARIDSIHLLPIAASSDDKNVVMMKLSPNGQLLWRKAIHTNNYKSFALGMQLVGDSSVVFAATFLLATNANYLYYLDTLIAQTFGNEPLPDYPFTNKKRCGALGTAFITLDLNGNLKEQHFLQEECVDSNNNTIVDYSGIPYRFSFGYYFPYSFSIDKQGNTYISFPTGQIFLCNGNPGDLTGISKFRIVVDDNDSTHHDFDTAGYMGGANIITFKFSPHFDSLLWAKCMIKDTIQRGLPLRMDHQFISLTTDNESGVYICDYIDNNEDYSIVYDSSSYADLILSTTDTTQRIEIKPKNTYLGFVVKYDSEGNIVWSNQLHTHYINYDSIVFPLTQFYDVTVNEDNNSVYVLGVSTNKGYVSYPNYCVFSIDDTILGDLKNDVFFLRLNKDNGKYLSHGKVNSGYQSLLSSYCPNHIAVKNNQVFTQVKFMGNLILRDTVIQNGFWDDNLAMIRWDEEGHILDGKCYNAIHPYNQPGAISIHDSSIYLTGDVYSNITFGDTTILATGNSIVYIAKYTDPTINERYVYVPDTLSLAQEIRIDKLKIYPNPTQSKVTIDMGEERIKECYLTPILGQREKIHPQDNGNGKYTIDLSSYANYTYVITLQTAEKHYEVKVIKVR